MKTRLLFNPFIKIAGTQSLLIGLAGMLIAGLIGYHSHTHFNGILNIHAGIPASLIVHLAGPIISVAFISIWFTIFALIFGKSRIRIVDIIGTQCFAFLPLVPASTIGYFNVMNLVTEQLKLMATNPGQSLPLSAWNILAFAAITLGSLLLTIWSAIWIYNGFKTSANLSPKTHIAIYITGLIVSMIVPKIILTLL